MKLHYDRDWYPLTHRYKGSAISYSQVGDCFAKTDWKNESVFKPGNIDYITSAYNSETDHHSKDTKFSVTDDLETVQSRVPVLGKDYCIREYYNDVQSMFDAHMTSVVEQYKGKYTVLCSGGIDSNMMVAWMYKNKLDFEVVGFVDSPRQTRQSKDQAEASINAWKKIVPAKIMYLEKDLLVKDYINGNTLVSVPKPPQNHLDGYDDRTNNMIKQNCDWILHGGGSNHTMLHKADYTLKAYNSLNTGWKKFKDTDLFTRVSFPAVCDTEYNSLLNSRSVFSYGCLAQDGWNEKKIRSIDHGCWVSYSRHYQSYDDKFLNLVNQEWYNLWEKINWQKLDLTLVKDLLDARLWRDYLIKYASKDVESLTKTVHSSTGHYTPSHENKKICEATFKDLIKRFKGNIYLIREVMACQWLLERYDKINDVGLALCHMEKFLQKRPDYQ
jgi:hypothetical protein